MKSEKMEDNIEKGDAEGENIEEAVIEGAAKEEADTEETAKEEVTKEEVTKEESVIEETDTKETATEEAAIEETAIEKAEDDFRDVKEGEVEKEKSQRSKKGKKYEIDMCNGPILKKMLIFALPLMLSGILQLLFNAADTIVVGRFAGDNSLAAVGSNGSIINLLTNLFIGLSVGANVVTARFYGAREKAALKETIHTAMLISIISGIILTVAGIIGARQILIWMKAPKEVLDLAVIYLRIYFIGMTATMVYNFGSAILRAVGDTRRPLYFLLISGVVNVILNLLFVIGLSMDVAGVALATVISQCISAALIVLCLVKEKGDIHLNLRELHINRRIFGMIVRIGLPAGIQGTIFSLSNVVIQSSINSFGNIVVAANSAASNIEGFVYMGMNALYQTTLSFTSQNMGAGRTDRINKILIRGQMCVIAVGVIMGTAVVFFSDSLLGIYSKSEAIVTEGVKRLQIVCGSYALCGMMDVMVGALRGIGYSVMPMIVSLIGACGLRLVWIATVFNIEKYHAPRTIYMSYPMSWAITASVHLICYIIVKRKLNKKHQSVR